MSLLAICVNEAYRNRHIATSMLGNFIRQMEAVGYKEFQTEVLLHNLRGKNLCHSLGFKEMNIFMGFDGNNPPQTEVVTFLRKENYSLADFR